ncbi:holo-ACP synthase [Streptomyces sp. PLAI1-29]|uniref:Holo-ACP synthase n=1 Tax=Streptomyces zingiberis TaxID=2053010 RepID=A0ABX1BW50_9ACTN|nr:holo-ACP synthase [Streptomyces zingiberis]
MDVLDRSELAGLLRRPWFLRHCYAPEELARARGLSGARRLEYLAGRFAAKEAVLKALGRGLFQGVAPRDILVDRAPDGSPHVELRAEAAEIGREVSVRVSITHKGDVVAAVALTTEQDPPTSSRPGRPWRPGPSGRSGRPTSHRKENSPMATAIHDDREDRDEHGPTDPTDNTASTDNTDPACTARLRVRIGQEDAHYGGGLVDGARILRLFGDLVTEITIRADGDEGLLAEYSDVTFTAPVRPGDYIEATARLTRRTKLRRFVALEARKVITASGDSPSAAHVLDEPVTVCTATAVTVAPKPRRSPGPAATGGARKTGDRRAGTPSAAAPAGGAR